MSTAPRSGERVIHQDFIARIRYSNALPPPPIPPKLLDIPNTGLASGQYTTPGFASRLAREQPLNIEADAELGMPLDLVGMPGVFDGDESSIQTPLNAPPVHPHDKLLLRPIAALGKRKATEATGVSFLRRTEYISNLASKKIEGSGQPFLQKAKPRKRPEAAADDPLVIKRKIDRGFELAEEELKNPKRIKHPSKRNLELVEATPLFPDLEAFPDSGAYVTIKFATNPVPTSDTYDTRLLSAMFRPIDRTETETAEYEAALEAHRIEPEKYPKPENLMNYDFFLGQTKRSADHFRKMYDVDNPNRDDLNLYTESADVGGCFKFNRIRAYETATETELDHPTKYENEILLAYNDVEKFPKQKGVYYYPVLQKSTIRPQRRKNIARTIGFQEEEAIIERMDVTVQDPTENVLDHMSRYKSFPLGWEEEEEEILPEGEHEGEDAEGEDAEAEAEEEVPRRSRSPAQSDASGDEE